MSKTFSAWRLLCSLALLVMALPAPAAAQQFTGTLRGTVQDSTGAVLPGASVSIVDVATNDTRTVTTDERGAWVLPNLKPATYRIVVTLDGFKTSAIDQSEARCAGDPGGGCDARRGGSRRDHHRDGRRRRSRRRARR